LCEVFPEQYGRNNVVAHIATEPDDLDTRITIARLSVHSPVQLDNLSSLYQFSDEENEENDPEDGKDHGKYLSCPLGLSAEYYLLPRGQFDLVRLHRNKEKVLSSRL
jgi:hypothetical protein